MAIKRLNYFQYQFLQENDFKDEQAYHLAMRRLHNKGLHTFGRVSGLEVEFKSGEKGVTIKPGMAIDKNGREIIVEEALPVDLTVATAPEIYLVIAHKEVVSDPVDYEGASGDTRITESFKIDHFSVNSIPGDWDSGLELILAKITLNTDGTVKGVDYTDVTEAGAKMGEMTSPGISFTVRDHDIIEWPGLKGTEITAPGGGVQGIEVNAKKTTFTGSVKIDEDLSVAGDFSLTGTMDGNHIAQNSISEDRLTAPVRQKLVTGGDSHNHDERYMLYQGNYWFRKSEIVYGNAIKSENKDVTIDFNLITNENILGKIIKIRGNLSFPALYPLPLGGGPLEYLSFGTGSETGSETWVLMRGKFISGLYDYRLRTSFKCKSLYMTQQLVIKDAILTLELDSNALGDLIGRVFVPTGDTDIIAKEIQIYYTLELSWS